MAAAPYLVALAMVEAEGKRTLPLSGKSLSASAAAAADPGEEGRSLALELLLRLWQRSDQGALRRAAGEASLLLVELPMQEMSEQLPILKAKWISGGDTEAFLKSLQALTLRAWRLSIAKYEPVRFVPWP